MIVCVKILNSLSTTMILQYWEVTLISLALPLLQTRRFQIQFQRVHRKFP